MSLEYNDRNQTWDEGDPIKGSIVQKWLQPKYRRTLITVFTLGVIVTIILVVYLNMTAEADLPVADDLGTLKLVSIVFRHGDRTPTGTYNSDPYKNYNWPDGWGELTNLGKQQMFHLGQTWRKRYTGFLPDEYSPATMHVNSSDNARTIVSALSALAGLYPPNKRQTWNSDLKWQPIPVHSVLRKHDNLFALKQRCPLAEKHLAEVLKSPEIQTIHDKYADLFKNLTLHCNQTVDTFLAVEFIYSHMEIQRANGLELSEWTKGIFPEQMKDLPAISLALYSHDTIMKRLKGGPLMKAIIQSMDEKIHSASEKKLILYSAHDLTVVTIWRTLGFEELLLPKFGASIVIELHDYPKANSTEVKLLFYNNSATIEPHRLSMPHCGEPCLLADFKELTKEYIPANWAEECAKDS